MKIVLPKKRITILRVKKLMEEKELCYLCIHLFFLIIIVVLSLI